MILCVAKKPCIRTWWSCSTQIHSMVSDCWVTPWESVCLCRHNKVPSDCLQGYIKTILEIGYILKSSHKFLAKWYSHQHNMQLLNANWIRKNPFQRRYEKFSVKTSTVNNLCISSCMIGYIHWPSFTRYL